MAKTLAERLAAKIERELGVVCDPKSFRRTYAGYWQKRAGAYVWTMRTVGTRNEIGSCDTATECVKKHTKLYGGRNGEIFAESDERK